MALHSLPVLIQAQFFGLFCFFVFHSGWANTSWCWACQLLSMWLCLILWSYGHIAWQEGKYTQEVIDVLVNVCNCTNGKVVKKKKKELPEQLNSCFWISATLIPRSCGGEEHCVKRPSVGLWRSHWDNQDSWQSQFRLFECKRLKEESPFIMRRLRFYRSFNRARQKQARNTVQHRYVDHVLYQLVFWWNFNKSTATFTYVSLTGDLNTSNHYFSLVLSGLN